MNETNELRDKILELLDEDLSANDIVEELYAAPESVRY